MRYIFVLNPLAGEGGGEQRLRAAIDSLPERERCSLYRTEAVGDATRYVRDWCREHPGEEARFIACGGDGTISEVCNGAVGFPGISVSCYPCGSGNDFVKSFGGAEKFLDVAALLHAPVQKLDLLRVGDRYSNNVINFGFDTTVAITVNEDRARRGHGSKGSYTKGILKALVTSMKTRCSVTADGELLNPDGELLLCTLGNAQYVGGSFRCAPRARTDDGLMEVCLVKPLSRLRFPGLMPLYLRGEHLDSAKMRDCIVYRQAKKVEVSAPEGFAFSLDGEILYQNRFTVTVEEKRLDLAVPV